ncbi:MAG TPA: hypothetical protein VGK48_03000 [Terriglobia bacterium]|jgi:hypothetical protein
MSKQDRRKLSILVVLLAVLGLILVMGYWMNQPATTAAVQPPETKTSANPPAPSDASIRMNLLDKSEGDADVGRKNIFEYRQPPPPPSVQRGLSSPGSSQPGGFGVPPGGIRQQAPVAPPGPPPIPLKYQGYLTLDTPTGGFTAVIGDDTRHYNVTVGEVLMGRYRILAITDKVVDVEDLAYNRRQSLPLAK